MSAVSTLARLFFGPPATSSGGEPSAARVLELIAKCERVETDSLRRAESYPFFRELAALSQQEADDARDVATILWLHLKGR